MEIAMDMKVTDQNLVEMIEEKKAKFANLPIFEMMRSADVPLLDKVCWIPAFAPMAMTFGYIWEKALREEPTDDPVQALVNKHTYEDAPHNNWYPTDIESFDFGTSLTYADSLRFIWGKHTLKTWAATMSIIKTAAAAAPIVRLAIIRVIEAGADVCLTITCEITNKLQQEYGRRYPYWGAAHFSSEGKHTTVDEVFDLLTRYSFTPEEKLKAVTAIELLFDELTECFDEMYEFYLLERSQESRMFAGSGALAPGGGAPSPPADGGCASHPPQPR
jgi:hypothetical protein